MSVTCDDDCEIKPEAALLKPWRDPANGVRIERLTGPEFEEALSGTFDKDYKRLTRAWLRSPRLKYFMARSALLDAFREPDTRVFFLASVPSKDRKDPRRIPVAALEMAFFGRGEQTCMGLKYVSVDPHYQGFGLATELYRLAARYLTERGLSLNRSRPGAKTPAAFTAAVTRLLDAEGVKWAQGE